MDKKKIVLKGHIVLPGGISGRKALLEVEGRIITRTGENGLFFPGVDHRIYDFGSGYICPGFIDLHVHGCGGADVMDGTYDTLNWMAGMLAQGGTTSFLATTMSAPRNRLVGAVRNAAGTKQKGTAGAQVIGVHLEGPFLNPDKKGAQKADNLRLPDLDELREYLDAGGDAVKMITIAPELPGALGVIEYASSRGVIVSLGHSAASITQVEEACRAGLSHVTHAFNAMTGFHHRDPGTTGAIMAMKQLTVDVIPDGHHVHPSVVKILVQAKGIGKVCAITDCMRAGRMGDGVFDLGGQPVTVKNGVSQLADGTISGSIISMAEAVKIMVERAGLTLAEAVQMVSTTPARILGLKSKGLLEPGRDADIVVLDRDFRVLMTMINGKIVYDKSNTIC